PGIYYTGQTSCSRFAVSTGWTYTDAETWGTNFQYDHERITATMAWYFGLDDKGILPPHGTFGDSCHAQSQQQPSPSPLATARSAARGPRRHAGVDVQRPGRLDLLAVGEEGGGRAADRLPRLRRGAAAHRAAGAVLPGDRRRDRGRGRELRRGRSGRHPVHRPGRQRRDRPVPARGELRGDHHDHAGGLRPVLDAQDRRRGLRLVQRPGQRPVRLTVAL